MTQSAEHRSLGSRAVRGSLWTLSGYGTAQVLRLASNLVMTRLLFAEAFGLMALVQVFMQGLEMFSDLGIGPSLIQNPRANEPDFFRTAWTLQVMRGLILWLVACAAAHPFARFYATPDLAWLIPLAGLSAVLSGLNSSKRFRLQRDLQLGHVTVLEIVSQLAGIFVTIVWALLQPTILALVAGGLAASAVRMATSHLLLPGRRDGLRWDRSAAGELVRFGRWIFLSTVFYFFARQLDRLVLGMLVTTGTLGVYSIGAMIAALPTGIVDRLIRSIALPVYSRVLDREARLGDTFAQVRKPLLVTSAWMVTCLFVSGPSAIDFLYDPRYQEAGWAIRLLAASVWFTALEGVYGSALLAHGRSQWTAAANATRTGAIAVLMPIGFALGGFSGAVAGFSISSVGMYLVSAMACRPLGLSAWRSDLWLSVYIALVGSLGLAIEDKAASLDLPPLAIFAIGIALCTAAWAAPGLRAWRGFRGFA